MGSDKDGGSVPAALVKFQFTLPRGERRGGFGVCGLRGSFNSRSRMGSDLEDRIKAIEDAVSIHAPAWGATRRTRRASRSSGRFNSRSRMGSDANIR